MYVQTEGRVDMQKLSYAFRLVFGTAGFFLLFVFDFLWIFIALALFSLGLIVFPSALLGMLDVVVVTTDLGLPVLAVGGLGAILLGGGLCLGAVLLCQASLNRLRAFRKGTEWKKRRLRNEET